MTTNVVIHGDCLEVMPTMADNSIDAIVTDPPYGLTQNKKGGSGVASVDLDSPYGRARIGAGNGAGGFMGLAWDHGVPDVRYWVEALRIAKPGAHLLAFGGTRTFHRLAVAIEDAGWELRDTLMWTYGSGFPKSHNVAIGIDKAAGVMAARGKAFTVAGAGDVESLKGTRGVPMPRHEPITDDAKKWTGWGTALKPAWEPIIVARKPLEGTVADNVVKWGTGALNIDACRVETTDKLGGGAYAASSNTERDAGWRMRNGAAGEFTQPEGRWPANIIHDGSDEVVALFPDSAGALASVSGKEPSQKTMNVLGSYAGRAPAPARKDSGSAARFFYCAKASQAERHEAGDNTHPTVKPIALMAYLCRLVTPPGGMVLDMFHGSGTTSVAARDEGFNSTGIEREAAYVEISRARLAVVKAVQADMFGK